MEEQITVSTHHFGLIEIYYTRSLVGNRNVTINRHKFWSAGLNDFHDENRVVWDSAIKSVEDSINHDLKYDKLFNDSEFIFNMSHLI